MKNIRTLGPKSKKIIKRDQAVISPSYPRAYDFVMDHGKGVDVWDADGNQYLDLAAGIAVNSTGHCHPKVVKAIQDQAEKFLHISSDFYHSKLAEIGEKLNEIAPFEEKAVSFLTNSGTEAVEAAIKLARFSTKRPYFISFFGGFHGRTIGSVTLTASKYTYHEGFAPLMNGVANAPYPDPYRQILARRKGEGYGETVVRYIEENILGRVLPAKEVAGIVIEPIQGEGGYIVPEKSFFPALRGLCDKHGILLIADEVQSGVGRTGKWWAIEHFCVEPDIVTSAKGIASGVPFGAMIARKSLVTWPKGSHGNTYGGNPIACAAALATIEVIGDGLMKNAAEVGSHALDALEEIKVRHPSIGDVRGKGLMLGIDFVKDRETKEYAAALRDKVSDLAFERGVLTLGCGPSTLRLSPPLTISKAQIDEGLTVLDECVGLAEKDIK